VLGAAAAAAGGNSALAGAVAAGGTEASAAALSEWLYGKKPEDLTAEQKAAVSAIAGLAGNIAGGIAGKTPADVAEGGLAAHAAVDNNYIVAKQVSAYANCLGQGGNCAGTLAKLKALNEVTNSQMAKSCAGKGLSDACRTAINETQKFISNPEAQKYLPEEVLEAWFALSDLDPVKVQESTPKDFVWPDLHGLWNTFTGSITGAGLPKSGAYDYGVGFGKGFLSAGDSNVATGWEYGAPLGVFGGNQWSWESVTTPATKEQAIAFLPGQIAASLVFSKGFYLPPIASDAMVNVSFWGPSALKPGAWVMVGDKTFLNYVMSFKWQPKWLFGGNNPALFSEGITQEVPADSIMWPTGAGWDGRWKGLFGQRKYQP
jgi:hypothetical protein